LFARFRSELEAIAVEALFDRFAEFRLAGVTPLGEFGTTVSVKDTTMEYAGGREIGPSEESDGCLRGSICSSPSSRKAIACRAGR
jgi:hypothetical protein